MTATSHSRRTVLAASAASAGALALAACGGDDSSSADSSPSRSSDGGAGSDTGGGEGGDDASAGSGAGGGTPIAALADVPVGEATGITTPDGQEAMLFRADEATVACFSAICTHAGCSVQSEGAELRCPCHQSVFDAATGEVLGGPAPEPLPAIGVRIDGDQIVAE
ncbi:Rieske (2Fe-2S) protein [Streptomyces hainanensis]|uniref:Cytochrome bc1 complex Rieske iron-sulfur subunit n=1 Tax=Streptomyces hainanensis TaxID=402648 RepID=A0A4R4THV9_9ACTN|nr:Rieske (2Fe-2S) protein [Streptomyces hainanensis]TDC73939.1 Rieske (2Fe-2S) protein [Streptomyces hainanensis]